MTNGVLLLHVNKPASEVSRKKYMTLKSNKKCDRKFRGTSDDFSLKSMNPHQLEPPLLIDSVADVYINFLSVNSELKVFL